MNGKNRKHWLRWDHLCSPKDQGGLNFRDISVFNDALLAKQMWRMWHNELSMVTQVFKSKYFPNLSVLDATLGSNPSYIWRSIWGSKYILKNGLIWQVGNGSNIKLWLDNWTCGKFDSLVSPETENWTVNRIMDIQNRTWNYDLIATMFTSEDQARILNIPISCRLPKDKHVWAWKNDGNYTVRSGYWAGKGRISQIFHEFWKILWGCKTTQKIKNFL